VTTTDVVLWVILALVAALFVLALTRRI